MISIQQHIDRFVPISLEQMDHVELMNRTDTKYVFHAGLLGNLLEPACIHYKMLNIEGIRVFQYRNLYYDTGDLKFYLDHHNGIRPRYKVRFREYSDTRAAFLEIKHKSNSDRTRKSRKRVERIETSLSESSIEYISQFIPEQAEKLKPALWSHFKRLTLVSNYGDERITIDTDLGFRYNESEQSLPWLVVCEVKRAGSAGVTTFMKWLKQQTIHPGNLSKYCLGTILLKKGIKTNKFKETLRKINKLDHEYASYPAASW